MAQAKTFAPGSRVVIRDEEWVVRKTQFATGGELAVSVTGLSELVRNKHAIFLTDEDDIIEMRAEETKLVTDNSPGHRRSRLYIDALLRRTPPTDNKLHIGHRGAMDTALYQRVPAHRALELPRPRILIADAVGLGKTIEVGILLSELIRRGRGERILVVALKSILSQFQKELWARFTIPLVRLDSVGIQRVQRKIPSNTNPFYYFNRAIISIDTLKKDEKYRQYLEECHWDVVVIDECQNVAIRGKGKQRSQRSRVANLLAKTSDALIMTSATPHDGSAESFASLINLINPTAIINPTEYSKDDIHALYVRRFKKDIKNQVRDAFQERTITPEKLEAEPEENEVFEALQDANFLTIRSRGKRKKAELAKRRNPDQRSGDPTKKHGALFRVLLLKSFLSSPQALISTVSERLKNKRFKEIEDDDSDALHDFDLLNKLKTLAEKVNVSTKEKRLVELLKSFDWTKKRKGKKVVVFSERIATLRHLEIELTKTFGLKASQIAMFYGGDDIRQMNLVEDFGASDGKVQILLCSDVASAGINLHHDCHKMIHYDLPWSLITLEQRNGRIDRFGQTHPPDIRYLLTIPENEDLKGDLRVLERLIEKEQQAHLNLGDAAWLMNLHNAQLEEERVAQGIADGEKAEDIIPEAPKQNLNEIDEWASDDEDIEGEHVPTEDPFTLFTDYGFAQQSFAELVDQSEDIDPPLWEPEAEAFTFFAPGDLKRRFTYLPSELKKSGDWEFRLTTDRQRVQDSFDASRKSVDQWPEWELFWDQHPIADWLNDRVLSLYQRHEATVIDVKEGIEPGDTVFVFQGIVSNIRSQPRIVDWFGVHTNHTISPFKTLVEKCHLNKDLPNTQADIDHILLELNGPVEEAKKHMMDLRAKRGDGEIGKQLTSEVRRLRNWQKKARAYVEEKFDATASRRTLRKDELLKKERELSDIDQRTKRFSTWVDQSLRTNEIPYVRLVCVLRRKK